MNLSERKISYEIILGKTTPEILTGISPERVAVIKEYSSYQEEELLKLIDETKQLIIQNELDRMTDPLGSKRRSLHMPIIYFIGSSSLLSKQQITKLVTAGVRFIDKTEWQDLIMSESEKIPVQSEKKAEVTTERKVSEFVIPRPGPPTPPPPPRPTAPPPPPEPARNWLWWLLAALVVLAFLWWFFLRPEPVVQQNYSNGLTAYLISEETISFPLDYRYVAQ